MLIDKNNLPLVNMDFMNKIHFEDVELINDLFENILAYEKDNSNEKFEVVKTQYKKWQKHTINHFNTEEIEMRDRDFFAYHCHKEEHESNLYEIEAIWKNFEETKDIEKLKSYIQDDLVNWLLNHIQTMDTVTAKFFKTGKSPFMVAE